MDDGEKIEFLRKLFPDYIRRPSRVGEPDNHGHLWYCFHPWCGKATGLGFKNHRSFDTHAAMLSHICDKHDEWLEMWEKNKQVKGVYDDDWFSVE